MISKDKVYWSLIDSTSWPMYLAATKQGLCYLGLPNTPFLELESWVQKHLPNYKLDEDKNELEVYQAQLDEYFAGKRKVFSFPLDLRGTEFQLAVWHEVMLVNYGERATYTEIATRIQKPKAIRAVGTANGENPIPIVVPCHRIVGKNGDLRGYRSGIKTKEQLLKLEQSN